VENGRPVGDGVFRVEDGGQILVAHPDPGDRVLRGRFGFGGHRRHDLPDVAHPVDRDEGLVLDHPPVGEGEVLSDDDRLDPGNRPGPGDVDIENPGVGTVGAEDCRMQHAGELHIHRVDRLAGHLLQSVQPGDRFSDIVGFHISPPWGRQP
jgi:hypothetical protein